ncbi:MAG: thiamine phosphate synthase [Myxococcota bacterium]
MLCLVVDRTASRLPLMEAVTAAVAGGIDWIQLRDRNLGGADWLEWAREVTEAVRAIRPEVEILVNRRLDVALTLRAQGAHLGFDAVSPATARALLGKAARIGASVHDLDEVAAAGERGLDYVHLAPVFDPVSKSRERPALGADALRDARSQNIPIIAQGGIEPGRCREVLHAGARGIAVTGAILGSARPGDVTAALRAELDSA